MSIHATTTTIAVIGRSILLQPGILCQSRMHIIQAARGGIIVIWQPGSLAKRLTPQGHGTTLTKAKQRLINHLPRIDLTIGVFLAYCLRNTLASHLRANHRPAAQRLLPYCVACSIGRLQSRQCSRCICRADYAIINCLRQCPCLIDNAAPRQSSRPHGQHVQSGICASSAYRLACGCGIDFIKVLSNKPSCCHLILQINTLLVRLLLHLLNNRSTLLQAIATSKTTKQSTANAA